METQRAVSDALNSPAPIRSMSKQFTTSLVSGNEQTLRAQLPEEGPAVRQGRSRGQRREPYRRLYRRRCIQLKARPSGQYRMF